MVEPVETPEVIIDLKRGRVFTGIIETQGDVTDIQLADDGDATLVIDAPEIAAGLKLGDSVAINGVCLTITAITGTTLSFDVMPQSLKMSALGTINPGDTVNMERALLADGRLDGHIVQGHVDGVATLRSRTPGPRWDELWFDLPAELLRYVCPQGSIAVAGVSLTVANLDDAGFSVALIPTTLAVTTLGKLRPGDPVNIEVDILGKYVERLLGARALPALDLTSVVEHD